MKIIKSNFLGSRCIRASEPGIQLFQIREVLNQHRDALLDRVITDLSTYVDFKFHQQLSRQDLVHVFNKLDEMKRRNVDMEFYTPIVKELKRKDEIKLKNDCFFLEIDETIRLNLQPQLRLDFAA
jgi:hypothetical protein